MNRRTFLSGALAGAVSHAVVSEVRTSIGKYGRVDVDRAVTLGLWPSRVFVNGSEIQECFEYDDIEGWADCWMYDGDGKPQLHGPDAIFTGRVFGTITIEPMRFETKV